MFEVGARVKSTHSYYSFINIGGTILKMGDQHQCWWVEWDRADHRSSRRVMEFHESFLALLTPLSPFEQRVQAYIQRELNP